MDSIPVPFARNRRNEVSVYHCAECGRQFDLDDDIDHLACQLCGPMCEGTLSKFHALQAKVREYLEARKRSDTLLWAFVNCEGDSSAEWEAYAPAATTTDDLSDALREMVKV